MDWESEGLLDGVEDEDARRARRELLDQLHADGVGVEELRRAVAEERLVLLPVERMLSSDPRYTAHEISERSGVDLEYLQASWRALGVAVPDPDERAWGERDLEAAAMGLRYRESFPGEESLEALRVLGRGMARYAEAMRSLAAQTLMEPGADELELGRRFAAAAEQLMPIAGPWLQHVLALHMRQVLRNDVVTLEQRLTGRAEDTRDAAIAFADIVGFTALGETVPVEELTGVAGRLSRAAGEVADQPVRVVKQIGDAVMLVSPEPGPLVDAALRLVELGEDGGDLPPLRAGIAYGPAVNRWGDWFGSPVNVASRLTGRARPASVLVTEAVRDAAGDAYHWSSAGEKRLKGLPSPVKTYRARRPD